MNQILVSRFALAASAVGNAAGIGLTVAALGGCGQQGPLYLPTEPAAAGRATLPETLRPGDTLVPRRPSTATPSAAPPAPATSNPLTP